MNKRFKYICYAGLIGAGIGLFIGSGLADATSSRRNERLRDESTWVTREQYLHRLKTYPMVGFAVGIFCAGLLYIPMVNRALSAICQPANNEKHR